MDSNVPDKKEANYVEMVVENNNKVEESKIDKEAVKAESLLFTKIKASIEKRDEVDQWRRYARRLEQECQRDGYWDERDQDAKAARIKANRIEREASNIEHELKGEDFEKTTEFSLKIMKEICVTKREAARTFREIATKFERDGQRLNHEINNMPPRHDPEKNLMNQVKLNEVDRLACIARYRAKQERLIELGRSAHAARYQASMRDAEIEGIKEKIRHVEEERAKRADMPKPVVETVAEKAPDVAVEVKSVGTRKDEKAPEVVIEGVTETRKGEEEPKQFNKPRVSWKSSKDREEENKLKTLKEYEKIAEEKKKALHAKFSTPRKVVEKTDKKNPEANELQDSETDKRDREARKQQGSGKDVGKHIENKGGKRMEKKVPVMDYLPVSRNSFYQRPQHTAPVSYENQVGIADNGNVRGNNPRSARGGFPRQSYTRNFGGQSSSNFSKKDEFPELIQ